MIAPQKAIDRFWTKVDVQGPEECWRWKASTDRWGYGQFYPRHGVLVKAHRFSLMLKVGVIPSSTFVCHRCDNPPCVNPSHLFRGSARDNHLDTLAKGRWRNQNTGKRECIHGHSLDGAGAYLAKSGQRACRACARIRALKRYHAGQKALKQVHEQDQGVTT